MDLRRHELHEWLAGLFPSISFDLEPLEGDASFRRYFRLQGPEGPYVIMDAPPERETCVSFVAIAKALRAEHLMAPDVFKADVGRGFLLMTDFGDQQLLRALTDDNMAPLYQSALRSLKILSQCQKVPGWHIPDFTVAFMYQELEFFKEWFLSRYLGLEFQSTTEKKITDCFMFLANVASEQPQVFMHRDYHSANLMLLENNQIGILDFQDAFRGPLMYDVVSLLRDCYIDWPEPIIYQLLSYYQGLLSLNVSHDLFVRWFDLMGLQRHLKALLTFSRKFLRDQNANYLQHVPRTLNYIITISNRYPECRDFYHILCDEIMPAYQKVKSTCVE